MRVMVLVKATEDSEKGFLPTIWTTEMLAAMGRFNDELRNDGRSGRLGAALPQSHAGSERDRNPATVRGG
jgi:hypothetical protein